MGGKTGTAIGLALLLAAGMAWAGGASGGEGNRGLSPKISGLSPNIVGLCRIIDNTPGWPAGELRVPNMIEPAGSVVNYYHQRTHIRLPNAEGAVTILQPPKFGALKPVDGVVGGYEYLPSSPTHTGKDSAIFRVEIGDYTVKVMYVFHVLTSGVGDRPEDIKAICGPKGTMWKISTPSTLTDPSSLLNNRE